VASGAVGVGFLVGVGEGVGEAHHAVVGAVVETEDVAEFVEGFLVDALEVEGGFVAQPGEDWAESGEGDEGVVVGLGDAEDEVELRDEEVQVHEGEPVDTAGHLCSEGGEEGGGAVLVACGLVGFGRYGQGRSLNRDRREQGVQLVGEVFLEFDEDVGGRVLEAVKAEFSHTATLLTRQELPFKRIAGGAGQRPAIRRLRSDDDEW